MPANDDGKEEEEENDVEDEDVNNLPISFFAADDGSNPNPRRGITKIRALVAFQWRRSWSIAVRCFSFRITICR